MPPKNPRLDHVRFVRGNVAGIPKLYAYFDTGKRKPNGRPVYVAMPPFGTIGFYDSYAAMLGARTKRETAAYTVASLADAYKASPQFAELAHRSQIVYGTALRKIADTLGFIPAGALERRHVQKVLDGEDFGAGTHNNYIAVLSALYTWARGRDKASQKPTEGLSKRKGGEHEPWPEDVLEAALVASDDRVRLATRLLYCTGQRIGDVLRMRWSDIRDGMIEIVQQKTGKTVWIPIMAELLGELARTPKRGLTIIANDRGQRRGDHTVRLELQAFTRGLGAETVPHGLRKNAVNALLEAGCTVAETASITGQSYNVVEFYAKRINQRRMAGAAIVKLETARGKRKESGGG